MNSVGFWIAALGIAMAALAFDAYRSLQGDGVDALVGFFVFVPLLLFGSAWLVQMLRRPRPA